MNDIDFETYLIVYDEFLSDLAQLTPTNFTVPRRWASRITQKCSLLISAAVRTDRYFPKRSIREGHCLNVSGDNKSWGRRDKYQTGGAGAQRGGSCGKQSAGNHGGGREI